MLELAEPAQAKINRGMQAAIVIALFWAAWRSVSVVHHAVSTLAVDHAAR